MNDHELRAGIVSLLQRIAPEIDQGNLDPKSALRDQVDLDSMDWLNFLVSLHERFGVEIPESSYEKLRTLDDIETYLAANMKPRP